VVFNTRNTPPPRNNNCSRASSLWHRSGSSLTYIVLAVQLWIDSPHKSSEFLQFLSIKSHLHYHEHSLSNDNRGSHHHKMVCSLGCLDHADAGRSHANYVYRWRAVLIGWNQMKSFKIKMRQGSFLADCYGIKNEWLWNCQQVIKLIKLSDFFQEARKFRSKSKDDHLKS
jgi:hypothetical protein